MKSTTNNREVKCMGYWEKPNVFKTPNFMEIPMGKHRVRISNVSVENYSKSKKKCIEVTLKVSRYPGLLWYHLWYSPNNLDRTNADFRAFFEGFQIKKEDRTLRRYKRWIGKTGAVYVWHEHGPTKRLGEDEYEALVSCFLDAREQSQLPPWGDVPVERGMLTTTVVSEELPFE